VAELLDRLRSRHPAAVLRGIAVSVNAEYAAAAQVLREGDEVGLAAACFWRSDGRTRYGSERGGCASSDRTDPPAIVAEKLVAAAKQGEDGAVVVFDGIVRNNSRGRRRCTWTTRPTRTWPTSK